MNVKDFGRWYLHRPCTAIGAGADHRIHKIPSASQPPIPWLRIGIARIASHKARFSHWLRAPTRLQCVDGTVKLFLKIPMPITQVHPLTGRRPPRCRSAAASARPALIDHLHSSSPAAPSRHDVTCAGVAGYPADEPAGNRAWRIWRATGPFSHGPAGDSPGRAKHDCNTLLAVQRLPDAQLSAYPDSTRPGLVYANRVAKRRTRTMAAALG